MVSYWVGWAVSTGPKRFQSLVSSPNKLGYADTPRIRIPGVRYGIRPFPAVSVLLRLELDMHYSIYHSLNSKILFRAGLLALLSLW